MVQPPPSWISYRRSWDLADWVRNVPRWERHVLADTDEVDADGVPLREVDADGRPVTEVDEIIDVWERDGRLGLTYRRVYPLERATEGPAGWADALGFVATHRPVPNARSFPGLPAITPAGQPLPSA